MYVRFGGEGFGNLLSQEGKALDSLAYYISKLLGKAMIDKRSSGETRGRQGSSSRNYDVLGRDMPYLFVKSWLPNTKINRTGTRSADNSANHVFFISFYLVQSCTSEKVT